MNIMQQAEAVKEDITAIRRQIHQNPELSGHEFATSRMISRQLEEIGVEVEKSERAVGVVGVLKGNLPGKTIALRADMDALPLNEDTGLPYSSQNQGVAHACGHDIHTAVLLGCAKILSKSKHTLKGNIKFIFQPAEEKLSGAQQMIETGVLENPKVDAILALHCWPELPAGTIGLKKGAFMASSDSLDIVVKGRSGHAAHPHKSIDPIVISGYVLAALQTIIAREVAPLDAAVITIGKINGGTAHNIIAASVEMAGTVRTISAELRVKMPQMIERLVTKTAESMNGEATVTYRFGTPPVINNNALLDLVEQAAAATIGKDNITYLETASMGGEDFAFYLEKVPGAIFRLGTANESPESRLALHNPKLIFDEQAIVTGMVVMCEAALQYLNR